MSIFTKTISQLVTSDLQELLDDRAAENVRLEFKRLIRDKDRTLKQLSSLANRHGGFIVIGARASGDNGRIEDFPGVDVEVATERG
jgi:predicted HTH transcriptional regulator